MGQVVSLFEYKNKKRKVNVLDANHFRDVPAVEKGRLFIKTKTGWLTLLLNKPSDELIEQIEYELGWLWEDGEDER